MIKKEEVFVLIKSLSKNEKRYFSVFCKREISGENYLKLFREMDKQDRYDEEAIKRKFKNQAFVRQLHVTKNYLRKMLLKSLRNFHAELSKDAELKEALRNIEILFNKELYTHCSTELKKAEAIARKYELMSGLLEVLSWKRKLSQTTNPENHEQLAAILDEQSETIGNIKNLNDYWQLATELSAATRAGSPTTSAQNELLNDSEKTRSLEARVLFYSAKYLHHMSLTEYDSGEKALVDLVNMFEHQPHRMLEDASLYASSVNNLVSYLEFQNRIKEAIEQIGKAKQIYSKLAITAENKTLLKQILRTYNIELEIYRGLDDVTPHQEYIEKTSDFIITNRHKVPKEYVISFSFQLASIQFWLGNLDKSHYWINHILNVKRQKEQADLQIYTRMLNLMVHYEQNNLFVLLYCISSTRRFIRNFRDLFPYEKRLLSFFTRICNAPLNEHAKEFEKLHVLLCSEDSNVSLPASAKELINFERWIQRKRKD